MNKWPRVSLGELLTLERRPVKVAPDSYYEEIGIYCFGRGIFHKPPRSGLEIGEKDLFLIKSGDFILQITFAWEGAVAVASAAEDEMYGSVRFPTFRVNEGECDPQYLLNYFRTHEGREQLVRICPGSAGRNRVLSIKRLPEVTVPLPLLSEQQRIVAKIDDLAAKTEEAHRLRQMTLQEVMALVASRRAQLMNQAREFEEKVFDKAVEQIRGSSGLPLKEYQSTGRYPVIDQGQKFIAGYCDDERRLLHLPEAVVVWGDHTTNVKLIDFNFVPGADGTKVFLPKEGISARFLFHFLKSVNFPDLGYSRHYRYLKQVLIPVPRSAEQRRIVVELDALQTKAEGLKQLQAQTAAELDTLLPSILDKAFKGEL